jgi:hypothetical protein
MNERYKIGEAKFFLVRMEESFVEDRVAFRYYLSAFLSAARSVLLYAKEESIKKGRQQWYDETIAGNDVLSYRSQTAVRSRFTDAPGSEDLMGSSRRFIEELEKFVQRGMEEGILSG